MNKADESWRVILEQNDQLHGRLLTWESLLLQLEEGHTDGRLVKIQEIFTSFAQLLERELARGFAMEECGLYADAAEALPDLRNLIWELHEEHFALRERLAKIRASLDEATFLEQPELTSAAGMEFSKTLRAHMRRDERMVSDLVAAGYRVPGSEGGGRETVQT